MDIYYNFLQYKSYIICKYLAITQSNSNDSYRIYYVYFKNIISFKNLHSNEIYSGNKMIKIINGNISNFKLKLVSWNKASKHHHNNHNVLDGILTKYKPHILNL